MKYIVRSGDGNEYGPVDQEVIVQWVNSGRVTRKSEVRNTLMKSWTASTDVPFILEAIEAMEGGGQVPEVEEDEYIGPKKAIHSLTNAGVFKYKPAGPLQRFLAWLFDMIIVVGFGLVLFLGVHFTLNLAPAGEAEEIAGSLYMGSTVLFVLFFLLYYLAGYGFKAQTVGQWFWGIMVIGAEGDPVYLFRALAYTLAMVALWPLTVLAAIMPERRSVQEILTGVRVVKITVRD